MNIYLYKIENKKQIICSSDQIIAAGSCLVAGFCLLYSNVLSLSNMCSYRPNIYKGNVFISIFFNFPPSCCQLSLTFCLSSSSVCHNISIFGSQCGINLSSRVPCHKILENLSISAGNIAAKTELLDPSSSLSLSPPIS